MSGPKISVYSLTGWARKVVNGQIQCEQQGLICGEQIKALLSECSGMGKELDKALAMLDLLQKRNGGQEKQIEEVKSIKTIMDQEIQKIRSEFNRNIPRVSPKYQISEEALEKKKRELEKIIAIKNKAQALKDKLENAANAGKEAGKNEQKKVNQTIAEYLTDGSEDKPNVLERKDLSTLESSIAADISGVFSFDYVDVPDETIHFDEQKKAIQDELMELLRIELSKELKDEIRNAIEKLSGITQIERLSTFDSITVKKIFIDLEAYQLECEKKEATFKESIIRYQMLCDMAGKEEERDREFTSEEELDEAISEIEKIVVKQKEQMYIADCVDEVMRDMGYDLIGRRQVRKKSGKQLKNELYQFGEGTAVNVTYSPDGQISMELGGLAREDRIPTTEETTVLTQDMKTFCGEFSEFEKRMKGKGIIVGNRIALMPPTADYTAIINVSDYEVESGKQITEMNVATKRKKAAGTQQVLRRGE